MKIQLGALLFFFIVSFANAEVLRIVPEEYETSGTSSVAASHGGVASATGVTAVRQNPALIGVSKEYSLEGGFHWPVGGREFFQAGVVDAKTSPMAAGVSYTSFIADYKATPEESFWFDSPLKRRFAAAASYPIAGLMLGVGGQYVEGILQSYDDGYVETKKGWTMGAGVSANPTPSIRIAASSENMANKKVQEFAPTIYRIGGQYSFSNSFAVNLDYRRRQRVSRFEGQPIGFFAAGETEAPKLAPEQMMIGSAVAKVHENVSFVLGYGEALRDADFEKRKVVSGGIVIAGKNASLSYSASRPQMQESPAAHQAVQLNLNVAM